MSEKENKSNSKKKKDTLPKKGKVVRAVRYNNPGCIRDLKKRYYLDPETNQMKAIVPMKGTSGYAIYATKEDGMTALALLLKRYQEQGKTSVRRIITIYAPAHDNNNTQKYISNVCKALQVSPNETLSMNDPHVLKTLMKTITELEGGRQSMRHFDESVYDTAVARVCSGNAREKTLEKEAEKTNPYFMEKPSLMARIFSKQGRENYQKWLNLNSIIVCIASNGRNVTMMDLNKAVHEGRITLEHASYIVSASQQSEDKSYTAINQTLSKMIPHEKQATQALDTVVSQSEKTGFENLKTNIQQETGTLKTLQQSGSHTIPRADEENSSLLLNKDNQHN